MLGNVLNTVSSWVSAAASGSGSGSNADPEAWPDVRIALISVTAAFGVVAITVCYCMHRCGQARQQVQQQRVSTAVRNNNQPLWDTSAPLLGW